MLRRLLAVSLFCLASSAVRAQLAAPEMAARLMKPSISAETAPDSAWLDLRQIEVSHATVQAAPEWVESVSFASTPAKKNGPAHSVFRIRVNRPNEECKILLFRLYFDDNPETNPEVIVWDESGSQVLRSNSLGQGTHLATSSTTTIPMIGVSTIDVEVAGDGRNIRGAYMDWMETSEVMHPIHAEHRTLVPEPFGAAAPLKIGAQDAELFGTVTAPLATETIAIGPAIENGASFQFELETKPLLALLSFEVATPQIDSPPEIYVNNADIGPVTLSLPDLADPGYRGLSRPLVNDMQFQYTGWMRAQKIVPGSILKAGLNDVIIIAGAGTPASAIRETQIQLKYLWDKSDYLLESNK